MKFLNTALFVLTGVALASASATYQLLPRGVGDKCGGKKVGTGVCAKTGKCDGISWTNYCPKDPTDVKCCVKKTCKTSSGKAGLCKNTYKSCDGSYVPGYCPGDSGIQCCVPGAKPSPPGICAQPRPNSCAFYPTCLESRYHCGPSGYPIGYGLKYCNKFQAVRHSMTPKGQAWVTNTMLCLQRKLVPFATTTRTSCPALRATAFDSHDICYVRSGMCTLPPSDLKKILETVDLRDLFGGAANLKEILQTGEGCVELYKWLLKQGIIKVVHGVVRWAEGSWSKILRCKLSIKCWLS